MAPSAKAVTELNWRPLKTLGAFLQTTGKLRARTIRGALVKSQRRTAGMRRVPRNSCFSLDCRFQNLESGPPHGLLPIGARCNRYLESACTRLNYKQHRSLPTMANGRRSCGDLVIVVHSFHA